MFLNSLRARTTAGFSLSVAALILILCGSILWYSGQEEERAASKLLSNAVMKIVHELPVSKKELKFTELKEEERDLAMDNILMMELDEKGKIIYNPSSRSPLNPLNAGRGWRIRIIPNGKKKIALALNWTRSEHELNSRATALLSVCGILLLFTGVASWFIVGHTLLPIRHLTEQTRAAATDNLRLRLKASSRDVEIIELVETLNLQLSHLEETTQARGRFYAAASHELRTPLQALSGHLELALTRERSVSDYKSVVEEAFTQTCRLSSLISALLTLNQLETGTSPSPETINVPALCEQTLCQFADLIESKQLTIHNDFASVWEIEAPARHTEMLIRNLIENALKYARPAGNISIKIDPRDAVLTIFNECDAIPNWQPDKLMEPFYRTDASRNSRTGGNGLGLALCQAISKANNWKLSLNQTDSGVCCTMQFKSQRK